MKALLAGMALIIGMSAVTNTAFAWGSLAIDSNQGTAYGVSYDYPTAQAADARAIQECGAGCRVVKNFATGCGAYAADQAASGVAYGWGAAATESEAKAVALGYCNQYGGKECIIRAWSCNTH